MKKGNGKVSNVTILVWIILIIVAIFIIFKLITGYVEIFKDFPTEGYYLIGAALVGVVIFVLTYNRNSH